MNRLPKNGYGSWAGWPVITTLLLAPSAAELLTSSTPPTIFFLPSVFPLFLLLYGAGALLAREIVVRWQKGWPSMLLLGAGYGVIAEGLCAKSFFDPHWRALGTLGVYGRWEGVNWLWALGLTLFHSVFSITLTVFCVYLIFPSLSKRVWLQRGAFSAIAVLFSSDVVLFIQKGNSYHIPRSYACVTSVAALAFVVLAYVWPRRTPRIKKAIPKSPLAFGALGFLTSGTFLMLLYFFPLLGLPAYLTAFLLFALALIAGATLWRWIEGGREWEPLQQFGLLSGVYGFLALLAPFQDFNPGRPDKVRGMTAVGLATFVGLALLYRRLSGEKGTSAVPSAM